MSTFRHGTALALRAAALAVVGPAVAVAFAAPALATPTAGTAAAAGTGTIQGFVWDDLNRNGIQDAGEPGAAGVTVGYQQIIDGRPGFYYAKATTGNDGVYAIADLTPGEYRAVASTADGWVFTTASTGEDRAKDSDFVDYIHNTTPGVQQWAMTSNVTVEAGGTVVLDAGVMKGPGSLGTIQGRVWNDLNRNGVQDAGEPGAAGVTVGYQQIIDGRPELFYAKATTGNDGVYAIVNLPAGEYRAVANTVDWLFTTASAGEDRARDSDFAGYIDNPAPDVQQWAETSNVTVEAGGTVVLDAGVMKRPGGGGTITGRVWNDLNRNGIQDAGEPGAAGVTVGYQQIIDDRPELFYAKATTGNDGSYSIVDLPAGEYRAVANTVDWLFTTASAGEDRARDSDFAGYIDNPAPGVQQWAETSNVTVEAGGTVVLDAGVMKRPGGGGTIQGRVWSDLNRNGIQDAGEPGAAYVTIGYQQIIDGRPGLFYAKVTTGHDGAYSIVDLPAGEYRAVASTVVWLFTTASAGEDRAKDSDFAGYIDNPAAPQQVAMTSNVTVDAGGTVVLDAGVVKREP